MDARDPALSPAETDNGEYTPAALAQILAAIENDRKRRCKADGPDAGVVHKHHAPVEHIPQADDCRPRT